MRSTNGRAEILRAARTAFAQKGYDGASIRDIAQEAGLSLSALYYYFPSKQHALAELVITGFEFYLTRAGRVAEAAGEDPVESLSALIRHLIRYRAHNTQISSVILRETNRIDGEQLDEVRERQRESRRLFADRVEAGVASGAFSVDSTDLAVRAVLAICNSLTQWYRPDGAVSLDEIERSFLSACMRLLGHPADDAELDRLLAVELAESGASLFTSDEPAED